MPRKLVLLRHAQTAGKQAGQRDFDRKLTTVGEEQVRKIGQHFIMNSIRPDTVLSSSAERASRTAALACESAGTQTSSVRLSDELYEADGETWIKNIRCLTDNVHTVLCVGHNPVLSWLASHLSQRNIDLSPAGFVIYNLNGSWQEFDKNITEIFNSVHSA